MDKQQLIERRAKAEEDFNYHNQEMLRLQGEWRILNEQVEELEKKETETVSDKANKVDATKVKGA